MDKSAVEPGCEAVALFDYQMQKEGDLSFTAGEILSIQQVIAHSDWAYAKRNKDGAQGVIPVPFIEVIKNAPAISPSKLWVSKVKLIRKTLPGVASSLPAQLIESTRGRQVPNPRENKRQEEKLIAAEWYHGAITREESERLILLTKSDGTFLVRDSSTHTGDYTLVVYKHGSPMIDHYRIQAVPEFKTPALFKKHLDDQHRSFAVYYTIDGDCYFTTINDLVQHYTSDKDGICTRLQKPVARRTNVNIVRFGHERSSRASAVPSSSDFLLSNRKDGGRCSLPMFTGIIPSQLNMVAMGGWLVTGDELTLHSLIGKGEFGEVYEGVLRTLPQTCEPICSELLKDDTGGYKVAVKVLKNAQSMEMFVNEACIMSELQHRNLVRLLAITLSEPCNIRLIIEFCAGHSLLDYLRSRGRTDISKVDLLRYAYEVCDALKYLELKRIVHRDVAARNVLLDHNLLCKLSDFGLARHLDSVASGTLTSESGEVRDKSKLPVKWTAPEAIRDITKFTSKSDVWSFGVLMHEIYSFGAMPYRRIQVADVLSNVENGYRMEAPADCPTTVYQLMLSCWNRDPDVRPSFQGLLSMLAVAMQNNTEPSTPLTSAVSNR